MAPAASDDALAVLGHADLQRCLQLFAKTPALEGTAELYAALGTFPWCAADPAAPAVRAALARTAPRDGAADDARSAADAPCRPAVRVDLAGFIRLAVDVKSEVQQQRSAAPSAAADACGDGDLSDIGSLADTVTTLGSEVDDSACPATPDGGRRAGVPCFEDPPAEARTSAAADVVVADVRRPSSAASARSQASSSPSSAGSPRRCVGGSNAAAAAVAPSLRSSAVHVVRMLKGSAGGVGGGAAQQQRPAAKLWAKCRDVAKDSPARCVREEQASSAFGWPAACDDSAVTHHRRKTDVFTMLAHMSRGGSGRMSPTAAAQPASSTDAATLAQELRSVYISRQGGGLRTTRPLIWPRTASPAGAQQAPSSAPGAGAAGCASRQKPLGAPRCYYAPPRQKPPERQDARPQPVKKRRRPKHAKPAAAAAPQSSVPHSEALSQQMQAWVRGTASDAWSTMYAHRKSQKYREQARAQAMRAMMSF
eukprot:Rhum_TRINITY_DN11396_c0_g1::Rhum_TRINITY_DN11396_c0_g1_i1::g.44330::m.44330